MKHVAQVTVTASQAASSAIATDINTLFTGAAFYSEFAAIYDVY